MKIFKTFLAISIFFVAGMVSFCTQIDNVPSNFIQSFKHLTENDPSRAVVIADSLSRLKEIPFVSGERVLFLYQGEAEHISWKGDFNNWGRGSGTVIGEKINGSNWWYATTTFPLDARFDYKIVIDHTDWIIDPANQNTQLGGAGYNSVLFLPEWENLEPDYTKGSAGITLKPQIIESNVLGKRVSLTLHQTSEFSTESNFGILVVTDGHEYMHNNMGNLSAQADALDIGGEIMPLLIIYVDPRNPDTGENLRADKFIRNPDYIRFIGDEIPSIFNQYFSKTNNVAIMGTSFGGFFATELSYNYPNVYPNAIIQSPAYWPNTAIIDKWKDTSMAAERRIALTYGTYYDGGEIAEKFGDILDDKQYQNIRIVVNEGHSWGAWRNQLARCLTHIFSYNQ